MHRGEGNTGRIQSLVDKLKQYRVLLLALSVVVVFITTYLLILPAFTLEKEKAEQQGGINLSTEAPAEETAPTYKSGELSYDGKSFNVEASFDEKAKLPTNTELKVKEIDKDSHAYADLYKKALETVREDSDTKITELSFAKFYDIALRANATDVEPADTVDVTISYDKGIEAQDADHVRIIHFKEDPESGEIKPEILKSDDVDVTIKKEKMTEAAFKADSFSVYVIVYTVDFEYTDKETGETYQYSMTGGESMKLSELLEAVGIKKDIKEVVNVTFSDTSLMTVTKNDLLGDWVLQSLKAFDTQETLTITMKDGNVVTVKVSDAQDTTSPWNLANTDNTQYLHVSAEESVTQTEQERNAAFKLTFTYSLEEDVVRAIDNYEGNPVLVYDISDALTNSPLADSIPNSTLGVITIGSRKLGVYRIIDNVVRLEFTDPSYFDGRTSMTGWFTLTVATDESQLGSNDSWPYEFPGTSDTVPITYKKTVEEGTKSVYSTQDADGNYTLHYTANINVNSVLDSMTFNDTLSGLQTLDASSVKINGTAVSVNQTGNGFNFDVASALGTTGVAKGSYRVTYDTKVTAAQLEAMTADKTTEINTASWRVNGERDVPGGETRVEINKPVPPIPVEKSSDSSGANQPGDTVTYTVTYGDANTDLAGFHISDSITDVVIPQGTSVTLNYGNGQTVSVPFGSQATDNSYSKSMVTLYDYTFPANTQGTGPVTATYTVQLINEDTAKDSGVYDTTTVSNVAREHRQNTSDTEQTTVTYEKEPTYTVEKTAIASETDENGNWIPGSAITYTLTIGDAETNMAGVNIKDVMTDLQTLQGDIMIQVGNGSQMHLSDYVSGAITWSEDGRYSSRDVELFNFNMPSNAGNGPVVITYTTKVISQDQASANGIYGDMTIRNVGTGGKQSDGTTGTAPFNPYPIEKTVTQSGANVNGQTIEMGSTVHYTLTFGDASMDLSGSTILDEMTDLQKLVSSVTIKKADGSSFVMPTGSGQWANNGVVWHYFDDDQYSTSNVRVFNYVLPSDIGRGPITVEYDAQIISEAEANEAGIKDTKTAYNTFTLNNQTAQTNVIIDFPTDPKHEPQISKDFDRWDVENSKVYWNITVEKTPDSAYPLENIRVTEKADGGIYITESNVAGWNNYNIQDLTLFDVINAVVTTDDGTVLTPGVDYTVDKSTATFSFPVLNERVHINLAFKSPIKIVDGYYMHNRARVIYENDWTHKDDNADATYNKPGITIVKNGAYTEDDRLIKWEVSLNPSKHTFTDSNPLRVLFTDQIPDGMTLVNYSTKEENEPTISVRFNGGFWYGPFEVNADVYDNNVITPVDIAAHTDYGEVRDHGLDGNNIIVTYYTKLSDEEWDRITSSASGEETFENKVTVTAGDNDRFEATDKVTVTSEEYLTKTDTTQESGGIVVGSITDPDLADSASKNISYKIEINPHGYKMNNGDPLSLTDYISTNIDLDTASVKLYQATMGDDGKLVPGDEVLTKDIVSYNDDSRLLAVTNIPDQTPMILVYQAAARAQGEDTFSNTATLIGGGSHSASTNKKHTIQVNDAGVRVDGIEMNLHKIDENSITTSLKDAKFQLYECKLAIGELINPEDYNQEWWENLLALVDKRTAGNATEDEIAYIDQNFKIVEYVPVGDPVITGEGGYTQWDGLSEHKLYAWKEVEAPDQYTGNQDYHYFVGYQHIDVNSDLVPQKLLSPEEQLERKHAAWALDDACQFANSIRIASMANLTTWTATNIHTPYTSISVEKVWAGDSDNLFETRPKDGIRLQLMRVNPDGTKAEVGAPVSINVDDNGYWPSHIWNRLLLYDEENPESAGTPYKYTVVEDRVDGYTTSYSDNGAGQIIGTITVTNKMIPKNTSINVRKVFSEADADKPAEIPVTLIQIRTDKDGNETRVEYGDVRLTASNNWEYAFTGLPTTMEDEDGKAYYLTYTVEEDISALRRAGFDYIVSYSDDQQGVIEAPANNPLIITNSPNETDFSFSKKWIIDNTEQQWKNGDSISVHVQRLVSTGSGMPEKDNSFNLDYVIGSDKVFDGATIEPSASSSSGGVPMLVSVVSEEGKVPKYTFSLSGLVAQAADGREYQYIVIEDPVSGYNDPLYKAVDGQVSADGAFDDGIIENVSEESTVLPSTGGTGTTLIYIFGAFLTLGAGVLLLFRRRKIVG